MNAFCTPAIWPRLQSGGNRSGVKRRTSPLRSSATRMTAAPVRRPSPDVDRPTSDATSLSSQEPRAPGSSSAPSEQVTATARLSDWALSNGIKMPKIRIASSASGRSLVSTAPVSASDPLLRVPTHLALVVDAASPDPPLLSHIPLREDSRAWAGLSWELRLGLVLLNEARRGEASPWRAYIDSLPVAPPAALLALHAPQAERLRVREQLGRVGLLAQADAYCASVRAAHAEVSASLAGGAEAISPRDFCWAAACAQSRAFALPTTTGGNPTHFAMLPAVDCGNHSYTARCRLEVDGEAGELVVRAGKEVREGEEVWLDYGAKTLADTVVFYGFVEGGSPHASVQVGAECAWEAQKDDEADEVVRRKDRLLERWGIGEEEERFELRMDEVDERLMMMVRVAVATEEEVGIMEGMKVEGGKGFRSVGLRNEVEAWRCVEEHCLRLVKNVGELEGEFEAKVEMQGRGAEPYSFAWEWGGDADAAAEALFRFEKNRVLKATIERVRHFREMSEKVGIVCTVLMPPSQSLIKANLFDDEEPTVIH